MKFIYYTTFLLILLNFNANAQSNFKPGYIVTLNGDTTKGFLDYKQWREHPDQVIFKANTNTGAVNYSNEAITAFGIEDYGNYQRYAVPLRQSQVQVGVIVNYVDTAIVTKNAFLKKLVTGKVSLLSYDDGINEHFFVAEGNSLPHELTRYKYQPITNSMQVVSSMQIVEIDTYKKQLQQLAALYQPNNTLLTQTIERYLYKTQDLKKIIILINGDNNAIKYVDQERRKNQFFIGLGVNANAIKFTGETHVYYPLGNVWSYLPQINAGLDLFSDKDAKLLFRGEMNLSPTQTEFSYTNTLFTGTPGVTTYTYKTNFTRITLSLNPQIVYNFYNKTKVKAFIAGGPTLNLNVYPTNKFAATSVGPGSISKNMIDFPVSPVHFNFTAKAGIKIERFQVYGAYVAPFNIYSYGFLGKIVNTSYNFGINYFLGK